MANKCAKCKLHHSTDDSTACSGPCERIFHFKCLDVSRDVLKVLSECRNLSYTCDACLSRCYRPLEDKIDNLETEFRELKALFTATLAGRPAVSTVNPKPILVKSPPQRKQQPHRAVKKTPTFADLISGRKTISKDDDTPRRSPVTDTPATPITIVGTGPKKTEISFAVPKFWVYLTGLDPETDDDILEEIVQTTFNSDDIKCVKLMPKNRTLEQCEFISYKIGFPLSMKDTALDPTSWPEGFSVREFRDKQQKPPSNFRRFMNHRTPQRIFHRRFRR
jgi:hypothetical protein